ARSAVTVTNAFRRGFRRSICASVASTTSTGDSSRAAYSSRSSIADRRTISTACIQLRLEGANGRGDPLPDPLLPPRRGVERGERRDVRQARVEDPLVAGAQLVAGERAGERDEHRALLPRYARERRVQLCLPPPEPRDVPVGRGLVQQGGREVAVSRPA